MAKSVYAVQLGNRQKELFCKDDEGVIISEGIHLQIVWGSDVENFVDYELLWKVARRSPSRKSGTCVGVIDLPGFGPSFKLVCLSQR